MDHDYIKKSFDLFIKTPNIYVEPRFFNLFLDLALWKWHIYRCTQIIHLENFKVLHLFTSVRAVSSPRVSTVSKIVYLIHLYILYTFLSIPSAYIIVFTLERIFIGVFLRTQTMADYLILSLKSRMLKHIFSVISMKTC